MEWLRGLARAVVGPQSGIYRAAAGCVDFVATVRTDGVATWRTLHRLERMAPGDGPPRPVTLRSLAHPILVRPGTEDAAILINNVVREEYGDFRTVADPDWMIDAGAYIGDTAAYFLSRFPRLSVVALEPNPGSFEMARRNLEPYGERAILLRNGLFGSAGTMRAEGHGTGTALAGTEGDIECTTVPALLDRYSIGRIGILKLDVEGAEESILGVGAAAWLGRVDLLIIEIHGPGILTSVSRVLRENGFSMRRQRSVWYCRPEGR